MNKKYVYLVRQTQPVDYYEQKTIYVCSTKERAQEYARKLNLEYGDGCEFTKQGDFIRQKDYVDYENVHYYDIQELELDEPFVETWSR